MRDLGIKCQGGSQAQRHGRTKGVGTTTRLKAADVNGDEMGRHN